nr:leucine-rich repeat protein [Lachnospiraceae bacterium]
MKKFRLVSAFLALVLFAGLLMPLSAKAAATSGYCSTDKKVKWKYSSGTLTISGTGAMKDYAAFYEEGEKVPWNSYRQSISKIVIGEGVTYIGANAFAYVGGQTEDMEIILVSLSLSSTVTRIGANAFAWSQLDKIDIPDTVTEIGIGSFDTCQFATSLKISKNLTVIPDYAFCQCANVTSVTIPSGVTTIKQYAFSNCEGLKTITIPASVTTLGEGAFYSDAGNKPTWVCFKGTRSAWNALLEVPYNTMLTGAKTKYYKPYVKTESTTISTPIGDAAIFKVTASGSGLKYQWQYRKTSSGEWTDVSAESGKTKTYTLVTAARHNGYQYRCKVTNKAGTTYSKVITLYTAKPSITSYTQSKTVTAGTKVSFTVKAVGAASYQWQVKKTPTGSWTNVTAESGTTKTYTFTAAARHNGYQYRCKVTNSFGHVYTKAVKLTVTSSNAEGK